MTIVSTLSMPERVWIPDDDAGFLAGVLVGDKEGKCLVKVGGTEEIYAKEHCFPLNPESLRSQPDNCSLMYLGDPHLLENIRTRYEEGLIYTYTAQTLTVVNPFRPMPSLYSGDVAASYRGKPIGTLPPHVYAIADRAYRKMIHDKTSQGVIVSGESGSGKTETSKHVMSYLAGVGGEGHGLGELEMKILGANPILEAFGNAKTVRNDNSSRFGKFTKINFDPSGHIVGAKIETYLLERSRVLFQAASERNFHIFYQMLAGLDAKEKQRLHLKDAQAYHYLNQGVVGIKGVNDKNEFDETAKAMQLNGLEPLGHIWELLAGLLHLGNVNFKETNSVAEVISPDAIQLAAKLLHVEEQRLLTGLTQRSISSGRGSIYEVALTINEAQQARDSLASIIYSRLFDHLVGAINKSLAGHNEQAGNMFVGILDIYGFESFQRNSFEQLTINYANEKIHQYFLASTFKAEQDAYKRESVACPEIKFKDNADILEMLANPGKGVFGMIDDESKKRQSTDARLLSNLHDSIGRGNAKLFPSMNRLKKNITNGVTGREGFVINHFAGPVCYSIDGFLDKNNSQMSIDAVLVLSSSAHPLVTSLFQSDLEGGEKQGKKKRPSISRQFVQQLDNLMAMLGDTNPWFVRCVKPNAAKEPGVFDGSMCLHQLRCFGMLELLELMKAGYPTRCSYDLLSGMYKSKMPPAISHLSAAEFTGAILDALGMGKQQYYLGVTKVFFKAGQLAFLEKLTGEGMADGGAEIVALVMRGLVRRRWFKATATVRTCVRMMRIIKFDRLEKVRLEKEKLEKEKLERERLEKERLEKIRLEMERLENIRLDAERVEKERVEKERVEKEKADAAAAAKQRADAAAAKTAKAVAAVAAREKAEMEAAAMKKLDQLKASKVTGKAPKTEKEDAGEAATVAKLGEESKEERLQKQSSKPTFDPFSLRSLQSKSDVTNGTSMQKKKSTPTLTSTRSKVGRKGTSSNKLVIGSDIAATHKYGVTIEWLIEFTNEHGCWEWPTEKVVKKLVMPKCKKVSGSYASLVERGSGSAAIGPAQTYVSHCWGAQWGVMVAAVADHANPSRRVWIDVFAVPQLAKAKIDPTGFARVITQCTSFMLVCSSQRLGLSQQQRMSRRNSLIHMHVRRQIALLRTWCLMELTVARTAQDFDIAILIKCGEMMSGHADYRSANLKCRGFKYSKDMIMDMFFLVDIQQSETTVPSDQTMLSQKAMLSKGGPDGVNSMVRGMLIGSRACGNAPAVMAAACDGLPALPSLSPNVCAEWITTAAAGGFTKLVQILMGLGVDAGSTNQKGETPYSLALKGGHSRTAFLIREVVEGLVPAPRKVSMHGSLDGAFHMGLDNDRRSTGSESRPIGEERHSSNTSRGDTNARRMSALAAGTMTTRVSEDNGPLTMEGGWTRYLDRDRQLFYYYNENTRETCWNLPEGAVPEGGV